MTNIQISYKESILKKKGGMIQISVGKQFDKKNDNFPVKELMKIQINELRKIVKEELEKSKLDEK